ncbi:S8/S53 family peptidase [archaeon]|nr:S8/S53 family peptidase [archaeon]
MEINNFIGNLSDDEYEIIGRVSNGLSLNLSKSTFDKIIKDERIEKIDLPKNGTTFFTETKPLIGLTELLASSPYYGDDVKVCVIDSGVYPDYLDLYQSIKNQSCFCSISDYGNGGCCSNLENESDSAYESGKLHGTYVSEIIASDLSGNKGIAPHIDLYVVKATDSEGYYNNIDLSNAIKQCSDWGVDIITMSLGDNGEYSSDDYDCENNYIDYQINVAHSLDITIFAASGNNAYHEGISYPACHEDVIGVGATYDWGNGAFQVDWCEEMGGTRGIFGGCSLDQYDCEDNPNVDHISCWTNTGDNLDLVAPGSNVTFMGGDSHEFTGYHGTSTSTPIVAGAAALLLEKKSGMSPSEILEVLSSTGEPIWDTRSQNYYQRINISKAIDSICSCTDWQQQSCGYSTCDNDEMGYTRSCDGDTCLGELKCEISTSCGGNPEGVYSCTPDDCTYGYTDEGEGNLFLVDDYYWTVKRTCTDEVLSDWKYSDGDSGSGAGWKSDGEVICSPMNVNVPLNYEDLLLDTEVGYSYNAGSETYKVEFEISPEGATESTSTCLNYYSSYSPAFFPENCGSSCTIDSKAIIYKDDSCGNQCDNGLLFGCEDANYGITCSADLYYKEYETVYDNQYCDVPYTEEITIDSVVKTNQDVDCYVNVESLESDPDEIKIKWYIDGDYEDYEYQDCSEGLDCDKTFTLDSSFYSKGDTIQCEARGYGEDGGYGAYVSSSVVTVSNTAPILESMILSDGIVVINDSLTISITSSDIDYDNLNLRCCQGITCNPATSPDFCTSNNNYCVGLIDDSYSIGENYIRCSVYDDTDYSGILTRDFLVNQGEFETNLNYPTEGESFYKRYIGILFSEAVNRIGNIVTYALEYSNDGGNNWAEIISGYGIENEFSNGTTEETLNIIENTTEIIYIKIPKNAQVNNFEFEVEGL